MLLNSNGQMSFSYTFKNKCINQNGMLNFNNKNGMPPMGWQLVSMHQADLMQLAAALPPLFSWMQRISTTMAEVSMCSIGNLMQHSIQVHACRETSIRMLKDIHSAIMAIFITGLGNLLEVRLSIWHFQSVHALWVFKFSHWFSLWPMPF